MSVRRTGLWVSRQLSELLLLRIGQDRVKEFVLSRRVCGRGRGVPSGRFGQCWGNLSFRRRLLMVRGNLFETDHIKWKYLNKLHCIKYLFAYLVLSINYPRQNPICNACIVLIFWILCPGPSYSQYSSWDNLPPRSLTTPSLPNLRMPGRSLFWCFKLLNSHEKGLLILGDTAGVEPGLRWLWFECSTHFAQLHCPFYLSSAQAESSRLRKNRNHSQPNPDPGSAVPPCSIGFPGETFTKLPN